MRHRQVLAKVSAAALAARLRAIASVDVRPALANVRVSILYLGATEDRPVPGASAALSAEQVPKLRVADIEGAHLRLQANPVESALAIREFIEELV